MRVILARLLALLTLLLALALSIGFAWLQHAGVEREAPPVETGQHAPGHAVMEREGCLRCHAVAGSGNPRRPLDGVGDRRDAAGLHAWIICEGEAAEQMPSGLCETKQGHLAIADDDMAALIAYLESR